MTPTERYHIGIEASPRRSWTEYRKKRNFSPRDSAQIRLLLSQIEKVLIEDRDLSQKSADYLKRQIHILGKIKTLYDFGETLYRFGQNIEKMGELESASLIYSVLIQGEGIDPSFKEKAGRRIEVFHGGGSTGERIEFAASHFIDQTFSPSMLLGMTGAWAVGRLAYARFLPQFSGNPLIRTLFWGRGAKTLASLTSLGVEAPTFTLLTKGIGEIQGQHSSWASSDLAKETLGALIFLGALKGSHSLGSALVHRRSVSGGMKLFYPPATTFLGTTLALKVMEKTGLRRTSTTEVLLTDSLASLIHLYAAGALSARLMPKGLLERIHAIEIRAREESQGFFPRWPQLSYPHPVWNGFYPAEATAGATSFSPRVEVLHSQRPSNRYVMSMASLDEKVGEGPPRPQT